MSRFFETYQATNIVPKRVRIGCVWSFNGSSSPTVAEQPGITSVTRSSLGIWLVTLNDTWPSLDSWSITMLQYRLFSSDYTAHLVSEDVIGAGTVTVRTVDGTGNLIDPHAGDSAGASLVLWLKNTTIGM